MGFQWNCIPADIFVGILHRLPPSPRRRLRLVCRHWRNVIDDRTPHPQARAKVLAFASGTVGCSHAYVVDDLTEGRASVRDLKLQGCIGAWGSSLAGTCNGLLCLRREYGDVVVINPVTGEKLAIPPPPSKTSPKCLTQAASYSFGYHPATGLYKVVQVPCDCFDGWAFDAVGVFTLGDTSWREVPIAAGSSCLLSFGLVSVDGVLYWVSKDACSVMSFDLSEERVAFVTTLPVRVRLGTDSISSWCLTADARGGLSTDISWHLTVDARGRLGLTVSTYNLNRSKKTEVWMLEGGGRSKQEGTWVLQYKIKDPGHGPLQEIALPHTTHGEHVLTTQARGRTVSLHTHHLSEARMHGSVVRLVESTPLPPIGRQHDKCSGIRTFVYVETKEPLGLYALDEEEIGEEDEEWNWVWDIRKGGWKLVLGWL
ncbi:unnamed protein product [Urochloa humidicola]